MKYILQINNTHSADKEVEENLKRVANDFKDKFPIKTSDDITIDSWYFIILILALYDTA